MLRTAKFDGDKTFSGFKGTGWFSRADTAIDDQGSVVAANIPRYGLPTLLCPAPLMEEVRSPRPFQSWIWSGRWTHGQPCVVENWFTGSTWRWGISVGSYSTAYVTDTGSSRAFSSALQSGWSHEPTACIVADGLVLVFCIATQVSDGLRKAVSCVYWDLTLGTPDWVLKHRSDSVQFTPDASAPDGQPRGSMWMANGPFVPPGGTDAEGNILDFFVTWVDYRNNGLKVDDIERGSTGGQLFLMRCTRTDKDTAWVLHDVVKLYEEFFEDPAGTYVAGYPMGDRKSFMHFHGASITFPPKVVPPESEEETQPLTVTLIVGDSQANNRMVNIYRDDYTAYAVGPAPNPYTCAVYDPMVTASLPSWPVPFLSDNGWTTYEDREGQRNRFAFQGATYAVSGSTVSLDHAAFAGYTHPASGTTTLVITRETAMIPFHLVENVAITGSLSATTVQLSRTLYDPPADNLVDGFIFADSSIQGVLIQTATDPEKIVLGGDEQGSTMHKYSISDADERIKVTILHGAPTHAAYQYQANAAISLGWNCFVGTQRRGADLSISKYATFVTPNSIDGTDAGLRDWHDQYRASILLFSHNGENWGDLYVPATVAYAPFGYQDSGDEGCPRYILGRRDSNGVYAIPCPSESHTRLRQPLLISPGGLNLLREYTSGGVRAVEVSMIGRATYGRAGIQNTATAATMASFSGLPQPPSEGPIMHLQFIDQADMGLWTLTDSRSLTGAQRVRGRLWIYRLEPAASATNPNVMPNNAPTSITLSFKLSSTGAPSDTDEFSSFPISKSATVPGSGKWIPFTFDFTTSSLVFSPNWRLYALLNYSQQFNRQDILIAWDFIQITAASSYADMPGRPLLQPSGSSSKASVLEKMVLVPDGLVPIYPEPPAPSEWSLFIAARIPESGPDPFVANRAANPDAITLFTISDAYARFLRFVLHRDSELADHTLRVYDDAGAMWEIGGPAADGTIGLSQPFYFLRGRQILIGISSVVEDDVQRYRLWASCNGTRVTLRDSAADDIPLSMVLPQKITSGGSSGSSPDSAEFFGVWLEDEEAVAEAEGTDKLETLSFLVN